MGHDSAWYQFQSKKWTKRGTRRVLYFPTLLGVWEGPANQNPILIARSRTNRRCREIDRVNPFCLFFFFFSLSAMYGYATWTFTRTTTPNSKLNIIFYCASSDRGDAGERTKFYPAPTLSNKQNARASRQSFGQGVSFGQVRSFVSPMTFYPDK